MKFAGKYELSDEVTTGRVETFVGRDVARGERVLVYIFDAPPKKPDQPTVQWVLESFRAVAPDPPGLVVATGKYGGTTYAYLVTQHPDDAVLRKWTQAYESFGTGTREITIGPKNVAPERAVTVSFPRPNAHGAEAQTSAHQPNDDAARFSGLPLPAEIDADVSGETRNVPAQSEAAGEDWNAIGFGPLGESPKREPGEFTRQFLAGSNEPAQPPARQAFSEPAPEVSSHLNREVVRHAPRNPEAARPERLAPPAQIRSSPTLNDEDSAENTGGGFTALFRPSLKPGEKESTPGAVSTGKIDDGKPGDFTRFFRGPFDGERPAETPPIVADVSRTPQRNAPGEFTRVFGSSKDGDNSFSATYPSAREVEENSPRAESGAFTRSFGAASQYSPTIEPLPLDDRDAPSQSPSALQEPVWMPPAPTPVESPVNPTVTPIAARVNTVSPRPSIQNGATQAFSVPREVSSSLPPTPTGPSQYTRIISGGFAGSGALKEQPAAEGSPHTSGSLPDFEMPAPAPPKITVPPAPKPPSLAAPAAPKAPEIGTLPKAKKSSLPMIIILNVLLLIAVLLIVYFTIKH